MSMKLKEWKKRVRDIRERNKRERKCTSGTLCVNFQMSLCVKERRQTSINVVLQDITSMESV